MESVVFALSLLTLSLDVVLVLSVFLYLFNRYTGKLDEYSKYVELRARVSEYYKELILLVSLTATSGSLFLSNVMGWEPCRLCWFQRIFMYPIVLIMVVAILFEKKQVRDYVIPLSLIGASISVYHYAIQRITQFHSAGCSVLSVSCETQYTFYFGYITIPVMALTAFLAVLVLAWKFNSD